MDYQREKLENMSWWWPIILSTA